MLEHLHPQPADTILKLIEMFRTDPRSDKIDLGVGVYRNAQGITPVMRAVKAAEQQIWTTETTKTYTALEGDAQFRDAMQTLVLGAEAPSDRVASLATVGGTGALHQALELIRGATPEIRVWVSSPTWPNHKAILAHVGLQTMDYRYFDPSSRSVDFSAMMADLQDVAAGDVVLLHGCCHNPTGADLTLPEWAQVAELLAAKGAIPLVDLAYQGFGDGLEKDAASTRMLAQSAPQMLIAASCSKNFGIYRDRAGVLLVQCENSAQAAVAQSNLATLNRANYSFPPDHGTRVVGTILSEPALRADWQAELEDMRTGLQNLRQQLADDLQRLTQSDAFGFLADHRGMFSLLGVTEQQVDTLRRNHGVYMVGDSRMNIAGLNPESAPRLAQAIAAITS